MKKNTKVLVCAVIVGVVLNVVLPIVLRPFASSDEVNPPNGAAKLSLKGQFMHMMVHHGQVMLTSSVIIAIIVGLSVCIAQKLC